MSDEIKPKSYEDFRREHVREEKERLDRIERVSLDTKQRLESDAVIQEYFKQFSPYSISHFIESYASLKSQYMEYGTQYSKLAEDQEMEYYEAAYEALKLIQYKKLFDLRCLWGANKIKVPEINGSWDFVPYSDDILNCKLIPPINLQEFELFQQYVASDSFVKENYISWNELVTARAYEDEEMPEISPWYDYHNEHTDTGNYLLLADERGKKEGEYRMYGAKEHREEIERKYETGELKRVEPDERPRLSSYELDAVTDFVKRFENDDARKKFIGYQKLNNSLISKNDDEDDDSLTEEVQELMYRIDNLKPAPAIEAHADWRIAFLNMWNKFEKDQIIAALYPAYQDYLFHIENSIPFETTVRHRDNKEIAQIMNKQVLDGREKSGEPRDFNF